MKKRQIVIQLISEFILQKPGRSFKEIEAYAEQLGASYLELKEAILTMDAKKLQGVKWSPQHLKMRITTLSSSLRLPTLSSFNKQRFSLSFPAPLAATLMATIILIGLIVVFPRENHSQPKTAVKAASTASTTQPKPTEVVRKTSTFTPPLVFASQKHIDAKKVFSYPSSSVSLKFTGVPKREVLGFLPYWMMDALDQISYDGYTTISIFGLDVDGKGNIITTNSDGSLEPGWAMWTSKSLDDFIILMKRKRIKVLLTVKSFDKDIMESLVTSDDAQRTLIANIVHLVQSKSLDGINIDFEYAGKAPNEVTFGFTRLIANLNSELKRQMEDSELSVDTYLSSGAVVNFFDVQLLQDYVDALVVMGYDIHSPAGVAGPVAPMEGRESILGYMQSYLERVDPSKLILAVPYYGYDWPIKPYSIGTAENAQLVNPDEVRILPYAEIANESERYLISWDDVSQTPFYQYVEPNTNTLREVHYENPRSLGIKYDYIMNKNLKGVGVWALGYDGPNQDLHQILLDKFTR